jgi:hypothetical protein
MERLSASILSTLILILSTKILFNVDGAFNWKMHEKQTIKDYIEHFNGLQCGKKGFIEDIISKKKIFA